MVLNNTPISSVSEGACEGIVDEISAPLPEVVNGCEAPVEACANDDLDASDIRDAVGIVASEEADDDEGGVVREPMNSVGEEGAIDEVDVEEFGEI